MFVNYRRYCQFPAEERRMMAALGSSAAIAIQSARRQDQIQRDLARRNQEIEALREIDSAISSNPIPDLRQVLELILQKTTTIIGASAGSVMRINHSFQGLELLACWPPNDASLAGAFIPSGRQLSQDAIWTKGFFLRMSEISESAMLQTVIERDFVSKVALLKDTRGLMGVIGVRLQEVLTFGEKDRVLLEMFGALAVAAIHIVDDYRLLNEQIRSLRSLCLIEERIQDAKNDLQTLLQMLVTGLTAGQGLGFSRAMIFLADSSETKLQGAIAAGTLSREEAINAWDTIDKETERFKAEGKNDVDILSVLLKQAEEHVASIRSGREKDRPLSAAIKAISIPLTLREGAIGACLKDGKAKIVHYMTPDPFRAILSRISPDKIEDRAFLCAPLIGKERRKRGVVILDNRFLPQEREIDPVKCHSAEAFAGVAAMSIENLRLREDYRRQAEQAEQNAKLFRNALVETAHEFRSPLSNILGQIPVLRESLTMNSRAESIVTGMEDEIFRAKKVMDDSLVFGAEASYNFRMASMRDILDTCKNEYDNRAAERNIRIIVWDSAKQLDLEMDPDRIRQVLTNLIDNAIKYSFNGEKIHIRGQDLKGTQDIRISVEDKGLGIPESKKNAVFAEFVRQVVADPKRFIPGTGVGLKIVDDIIKAHRGGIEVSSVPFLDDPTRQAPKDGHTVTFTITLPKVRKQR